jgi:hypothetical protein
MIADDVTPFGPSDDVGVEDVVVLPFALVVVVVLLAAEIDGAASASTMTELVTATTRRHERNTPRTVFTLPPRW